MAGTPDVRVAFHGSICLVSPESEAAEAWINEHVDTEEAQFWAGALVVEPRYLEPLVEGMVGDGLTVLAG